MAISNGQDHQYGLVKMINIFISYLNVSSLNPDNRKKNLLGDPYSIQRPPSSRTKLIEFLIIGPDNMTHIRVISSRQKNKIKCKYWRRAPENESFCSAPSLGLVWYCCNFLKVAELSRLSKSCSQKVIVISFGKIT